MDTIFSTRMDESTKDLIDRLSKSTNKSKKKIIEEAVKLLWEKNRKISKKNIFSKSFGAWKRDESVDETIRNAKGAFEDGMKRRLEE